MLLHWDVKYVNTSLWIKSQLLRCDLKMKYESFLKWNTKENNKEVITFIVLNILNKHFV